MAILDFQKPDKVVMIDQTKLPNQLVFVEFDDFNQVADAIRTLVVRGAPAIGVSGAFGLALAALQSKSTTKDEMLSDLEDAKKIHAAKKAEGKVSAFYHGLTAEKKIVSVLPLEVILPKREVLLPVDESFNLKVIGGSGYHIFESKNKDIAIVSFNG